MNAAEPVITKAQKTFGGWLALTETQTTGAVQSTLSMLGSDIRPYAVSGSISPNGTCEIDSPEDLGPYIFKLSDYLISLEDYVSALRWIESLVVS